MSQFCEKCGKGPSTGHNVSHSVRRTKRRFLPNLFKKIVTCVKTGKTKKMKICTRCMRTQMKTRA